MTSLSETNLSLSTRRRRISAFIIDHLVLTFAMVSIIFLSLGPNFMDDSNMAGAQVTMFAVMIPGLFLYFAKDIIKGISLGKWIMGIMVRNADHPNAVPSSLKLFTRNLLLIIWPAEFLVLVLDRNKRRLGDKAAGTIVVDNPDRSKRALKILTLVGIVITFVAFIFLFTGNAMKSSDAYKVALAEIEMNKEILNATGGIKGYGMIPAGNINISNGIGKAQLQIKVLGIEKDLDVNVYLTKEPNGQWRVVELR